MSLFVKRADGWLQNRESFYINGCFCDPFRKLIQTVLLLGGVAVIWTLLLRLLSIHNDRKLPSREWVCCTRIQRSIGWLISNSIALQDFQVPLVVLVLMSCILSHTTKECSELMTGNLPDMVWLSWPQRIFLKSFYWPFKRKPVSHPLPDFHILKPFFLYGRSAAYIFILEKMTPSSMIPENRWGRWNIEDGNWNIIWIIICFESILTTRIGDAIWCHFQHHCVSDFSGLTAAFLINEPVLLSDTYWWQSLSVVEQYIWKY